jgi:hypothetical protein
MILTLLLSLVAPAVAQKADDPPVRIEINHEQFTRGDRARVYVEAAEDGHLVVLHADPEGRIRVLFPLDPSDDDFVRGGRKVEIRGRSDRDAFFVDAGDGSGTVVAVLSPDPLTFDPFVRNDHWDYRSLGPTSEDQRSDPLATLLDVARRMAGDSHFEYDVATYVVGDRIASRYGYGSDDYGFGSYGFGHPYRYSFGVGFGYPWGYDPFCYDPFWGWSCGARFGGFGYYSPYSYSRYYYARPYYSGAWRRGFGAPRGFGRGSTLGSGFVIPRDRVRYAGIQPRARVGFANPGPTARGSRERVVAPRSVQPRGRDRAVSPRSGSSRGPTMSRPSGGSRGRVGPSTAPRGGGGGGGSRSGARSGGGGSRSGGGGGRRH